MRSMGTGAGAMRAFLDSLPADVAGSPHLPSVVNEHAGRSPINEHTRAAIIGEVRRRESADRQAPTTA